MSAPLDPERSEMERTLWHHLDEAGWSDREIQEAFTEYRDFVAHELAEKIRELPLSPSAILLGGDIALSQRAALKAAADLIDPEVNADG